MTDTVMDERPVTGDTAPVPDPKSAPEPPADPSAKSAGGAARSFLSGRAAPKRSPNRPAESRAKREADKKPAKSKTDSELKKALMDLYAAGGMMLLPFDQPCGTAVMNSAESCADSLVKLAQENDSVRRALTGLTQTSAWGGVIAAHLPIMMAVAGHHFGVGAPTPDNVRPLRPEDEEPVRQQPTSRANGGRVGRGKFCPKCNGAVLPGVVHACPNGVS